MGNIYKKWFKQEFKKVKHYAHVKSKDISDEDAQNIYDYARKTLETKHDVVNVGDVLVFLKTVFQKTLNKTWRS